MEQMTYITGATATHLDIPKANIEAYGTSDGAAVIVAAKAGEILPIVEIIRAIEAKALLMNLEV